MPDSSAHPIQAHRDASRLQEGRSERRAQAYSPLYVMGLNDARTKLAGFFSILLVLDRSLERLLDARNLAL